MINCLKCVFIHFYVFLFLLNLSHGILYPYDSETRESKSLNGLWTFKISANDDVGFNNLWYKSNLEETGDTLKMPVPASFNDITTNSTIRDFLGWSWYQHSFFVPRHWHPDSSKRIFIHFGGVHYLAKVWLNGIPIGEHVGGYLPFQVESSEAIQPQTKNILTVAVHNALHSLTLPQATIKEDFTEMATQKYKLFNMNCDYYNYGGINRPVTIFSTPNIYICDVDIVTNVENDKGIVDYKIKSCGGEVSNCTVKLHDAQDTLVAESNLCEGKMEIENASLWWPITSDHSQIGYMYNFQATIFSNSTEDIYRLPIGIRKVKWDTSKLYINDEPVYLRGLGMHEDSNIRGRGFDYSVLSRDLSLIQWLGANSFRTSHYPYAEETIHEADSRGILVIMEAPACGLNSFEDDIYQVHEDVVKEMISHFNNRPSIIMWSMANEPMKIPTAYFKKLIIFAKSIDSNRPVTIVIGQHAKDSKGLNTALEYVDVICVNRYYGWYTSPGRLDLIQPQLLDEFRLWNKSFHKPVVMSEYGAGSLPGYSAIPSTLWTEDYHVDFMIQHFQAFDVLQSENSLAGEMVWNFIDFNVQQEYFRPGKCSKGLFTRERQPKAASYLVRARYLELAQKNNPNNSLCQSLHLGMRDVKPEPLIQSISSTSPASKNPIEALLLISIIICKILTD